MLNKLKIFFVDSLEVGERSFGWIPESIAKTFIVDLSRVGGQSPSLNLYLYDYLFFLKFLVHHHFPKSTSKLFKISFNTGSNCLF